MKELTANQKHVLKMLRDQDCHFLARATEQAWSNGES